MNIYQVRLSQTIQGSYQCLSIGRIFQPKKLYELTEKEMSHPQIQDAVQSKKLVIVKVVDYSKIDTKGDNWVKAEAILTRLVDRIAMHVQDIGLPELHIHTGTVPKFSPRKTSTLRPPKAGKVEKERPKRQRKKIPKEDEPMFLASPDLTGSSNVQVESESEKDETLNSVSNALRRLRENKE